MPKQVIKHKSKQTLYDGEDGIERLAQWLSVEVEDAFTSRVPLEIVWRELFRMYDGVPKKEVNDFPIENAPNIEVTLGAIATDSVYAQMIDLIFGTNPLVTCRPVPKRKDDKETIAASKAMQRFVNLVAETEAQVRFATEEPGLDDVQLGTGVLYIPWVENVKKTRTAKVINSHPVIRPIPPEDCIVPGGSCSDLEEVDWVGIRFIRRIQVHLQRNRS